MRRRKLWIGLLAVTALLAGACGGGTSGNNATKSVGGVLTIDNESGKLWDCDFNPYNGSVNGQSFGILYEPLVYNNLLNQKTNSFTSGSKKSTDSNTLPITISSAVNSPAGRPLCS